MQTCAFDYGGVEPNTLSRYHLAITTGASHCREIGLYVIFCCRQVCSDRVSTELRLLPGGDIGSIVLLSQGLTAL